MKKLLSLLLLLSSFAYADVEKLCLVVVLEPDEDSLRNEIDKEIKESDCKKNNILKVMLFNNKPTHEPELTFSHVAAQYCRFDRNTIINSEVLACVLYSPIPRYADLRKKRE